MRWLVGWSSIAASFGTAGRVSGQGGPGSDGPLTGGPDGPLSGGIADADHPDDPAAERTVVPVGAQLLWGDPDPLWAVGDWRPDEIRTLAADPADPFTRLAVLGCCGATDAELRRALLAARGGALRHLTQWSGSYTAVVQTGRRITVVGDLAGARPVFYTPWAGGTAYATAALPLADLIEAQLDIGHLAALLACPDSPEALGDGTPYVGVRRIPPGHALILREGSREITGYEPVASSRWPRPRPIPSARWRAYGKHWWMRCAPGSRHRGMPPTRCPTTPARCPEWALPTGARPGAHPRRSPASAPTSPEAAPPRPWPCSPPASRAHPAR